MEREIFEKAQHIAKKIPEIEEEIHKIDKEIEKGNWNQELGIKRGKLEEELELAKKVKQLLERIKEAEEIIAGDSDPELVQIAIEEKKDAERQLEKLLEDTEEDAGKSSCIVEIRAGVGGEEAALFAGELVRMYIRWAEKRGWDVKPVEVKKTPLGGVKEAVFIFEGKGVLKEMRKEAGVHRVQRVPITESSGRIHTSTATVAVLEEPDEIQVQIDPRDIVIETFRASGPGGQHVNKTDSAVRIKHVPTGIVVTCQEERSQHMNKERALRILKARLFELKKKEQEQKIVSERRQQIKTAERSEKVRTYNFMQNRVTDHRLGVTVYQLEEILDGNIDLIYKQLEKERKGN